MKRHPGFGWRNLYKRTDADLRSGQTDSQASDGMSSGAAGPKATN